MNFNNRPVAVFLITLLVVASPGCGGEEQPQRTITELSGNVYRARDGQHFTVFLVTSEGIILADPINRAFSTWLKTELAERFQVPVKYLLYSHHHWDHASGGAVFADTATFVGHENMLEQLAMPPADTPLPAEAAGQDADGNGTLEASEAAGNYQRNFGYFDANEDGRLNGAEIVRGPVSDVRRPDITYRDKATISLGGHSVELTWTGPITHTDDMSVIRFPGAGVLFVVDFISIETLPFRTLGSGLLDEWLASIRAVEAMEFERVAPGHGVVGSKADVAAHRRYIEELRAAVASGMERGQTVEELKQSIDLERYRDWFMYDEWHQENIAGMYAMLTAGD